MKNNLGVFRASCTLSGNTNRVPGTSFCRPQVDTMSNGCLSLTLKQLFSNRDIVGGNRPYDTVTKPTFFHHDTHYYKDD